MTDQDAFAKEFIDRIAATFGVTYDQMTGVTRTTAAEVEERLRAYRLRERYRQAFINHNMNLLFFDIFLEDNRYQVLRALRREVGKTITKRRWRRLRGQVKAGQRVTR